MHNRIRRRNAVATTLLSMAISASLVFAAVPMASANDDGNPHRKPASSHTEPAATMVTARNDRVARLLASMSLEDKVGQMMQPDTRHITPQQAAEYHIGSILSGGGAAPESGNSASDWANRADSYQHAVINETGIPLLYGVDAVHGHNNVADATLFPHNVNLGQTGNAELVKQIGAITASEVRATGSNWVFTPTLGLPKNERWGRTYEAYGENADLSAKLGAAYIEGSQAGESGSGLAGSDSAIATAKHFIGEGITKDGVNQGDVPLDYNSEAFRKILDSELLVPYRAAVQDANVRSVMVSYNSIGGVKCHGNADLLTNVLKRGLGFTGIVITDYNGIDQIEGNLNYAQKVAKAVNAGVDMLMVDEHEGTQPKWIAARQAVIDGVNSGDIAMARVDDAVTRILNVKDEMGLLENPQLAYSNKELLAQFGGEAHRAVAREAVAQSLTLLKNRSTDDGSTLMNDLPSMKRIVVAGSSANDIGMQSGGWTITWQGSAGDITSGTTIYEGLKTAGKENGQTVDLKEDGSFTGNYDAAIVVAGESPYAEYAGDRTADQLTLQQKDINTISSIRKTHPNLPIVLVLTTGRALTITDQLKQVDAVVMAGFPGSEGEGVADVLLSADRDFSGHLTTTWPKDANNIAKKYIDPNTVLFPYGTGLVKSQVN